MLIGKFITFIPKCEMVCDLVSVITWKAFAAHLSFLLSSISSYVLILSCILQSNDKHLE